MAYLACRQDHDLMDGTPLAELGFTPTATESARRAAANDFEGKKNKEEFVAGMHIKDRRPLQPDWRRGGGGH